MEIVTNPRLFWFLKEGTVLDLANLSHLDLYVQQVLTRGRAEDVRALLGAVTPERFTEALRRLNRFLPLEVKRFWEDFLAGH